MHGKDINRLLAGTSLIMEHMIKQGQRNGNIPVFQRLPLVEHFPLGDPNKVAFTATSENKVNVERKANKDRRNTLSMSTEYGSKKTTGLDLDIESKFVTENVFNKPKEASNVILMSKRSKNRNHSPRYNYLVPKQKVISENKIPKNNETPIQISNLKNKIGSRDFLIPNAMNDSSETDNKAINMKSTVLPRNKISKIADQTLPIELAVSAEAVKLSPSPPERLLESNKTTNEYKVSAEKSVESNDREKIVSISNKLEESALSNSNMIEENVPSPSMLKSNAFSHRGTNLSTSMPISSSNSEVSTSRREKAVPSTPLARVLGFGGLAARLAIGTMYEAVIRNVDQQIEGKNRKDNENGANTNEKSGESNGRLNLMSEANAERLAETLCRMRGAALKLGQMLSIQDENVLPKALVKALERVRQGADVMPRNQLHQQLTQELGENWRSKLLDFNEEPLAAASIGQVHRATLHTGQKVVMKIQYPGVADSIDSDLYNLKTLISVMNFLPPGLYIDEIISVAKEELTRECDYKYEAENQIKFRELVMNDSDLSSQVIVPDVIPELSTTRILTSEYVEGKAIDQVATLDQGVRNEIADLVLNLSMKELFEWRFMQTDPNWGNFLYDVKKGKLALIDFGAAREYSKKFVDDYLELVWSAANEDTHGMIEISRKMGFLTGDESTQMMDAHEKAGLVVGEPFVKQAGSFDFVKSKMTTRISAYGDTFMRHRLTPPPREAYSLHRKLAGAFLICIKLKAIIPCRPLLEKIYYGYKR